jgi:hypothetical protein
VVVRVENSLRFSGDCVIAQNPSLGIWEHEVAGSNPVAPTSDYKELRVRRFSSRPLVDQAGSIELFGEARDDALEQLVNVAKQRFGSERVTLLGRKHVQRRLTEIAAERGLDLAEGRER